MMIEPNTKDKAHLLSLGCCPVHGFPMPNTGRWRHSDKGVFSPAHCPRKECGIVIKIFSCLERFEIMPEFAHIMDGN